MFDTPAPGKTVEQSGLKHWIYPLQVSLQPFPTFEAHLESLSFQGMAEDGAVWQELVKVFLSQPSL